VDSLAQVTLEAGSPLALRLTDRQVLTTKLRRIDREGSPVTGLPHPPVVQTGRQLELAWHDGRRWRSEPRYRLALGVRVTVEKGRTLRPGSELRSKTEDVSLAGISFTVDADVHLGDLLRVTMLGSEGQIGNDTRAKIVRATRRPGATATSVGVAFDHPPGALTSALRRLIWSQG
jgi:hypothetical protein